MSNPKNRKRCKQLKVFFTEEEYADLQRWYTRSTCLSMRAYIRKVSLQEPVTLKIRNASLDDFIAAIIPLQKELRTIHRLNRLTPENETTLLEIHRSIQHAIEKITLPCMPS